MLAGGAMLGSIGLMAAKQKNVANFVGQWVPTLLLLGIYNKLGAKRRLEPSGLQIRFRVLPSTIVYLM